MIVSMTTARLISCELSALVTSAHEHDSITTETDGSSSGRWRKRSHTHLPTLQHGEGGCKSAAPCLMVLQYTCTELPEKANGPEQDPLNKL
ncbi:unnamed protein product [Arctogadus glacialis]